MVVIFTGGHFLCVGEGFNFSGCRRRHENILDQNTRLVPFVLRNDGMVYNLSLLPSMVLHCDNGLEVRTAHRQEYRLELRLHLNPQQYNQSHTGAM